MPRYEFDPSKVQAGIEVFPKGDYEFVIGEPKSFARKNRKNEDSFGVRFPITIAEDMNGGNTKGKRTIFTCYQQNEGSQSMSKQFLMAVLGFKSGDAGEREFNAQYGGQDWSFDPDTGTVGEAWQEAAGKRVIGTLDQQPNPETGDPQQQFKKWRPIGT